LGLNPVALAVPVWVPVVVAVLAPVVCVVLLAAPVWVPVCVVLLAAPVWVPVVVAVLAPVVCVVLLAAPVWVPVVVVVWVPVVVAGLGLHRFRTKPPQKLGNSPHRTDNIRRFLRNSNRVCCT
jgi:hypothetical protein